MNVICIYIYLKNKFIKNAIKILMYHDNNNENDNSNKN